MQQERCLSSNIFTSWPYCTNVANLDMRIFEIKCYFRDLIGQFISFMVGSRRRQHYRIVHMISTSIQKRHHDSGINSVCWRKRIVLLAYVQRKIDRQFGFSALYHILPESCIQHTVYQAGSPATYISSCQIPLPPAILQGEALDGRKHKST